ncbi:MAG: helix-turn-helix domain-containing protein [Syntrophorhabdaceae bacterium]|nr:helix-turn-helix domain-containing protein [Syntrophorhabdaceae bacterium]
MDMFHTAEEWEQEIGQQLRRMRLLQDIDQRVLAERAGVSLNALKNLEGGKGATVRSFVRVLRALGRAEWLTSLSPEVSISPMQILESKKKSPRQRASRRKGTPNA